MMFQVSHIYHQENYCASRLANYGLQVENYIWWNLVPNFISSWSFRDKMGLLNYHFCLFVHGFRLYVPCLSFILFILNI